MIAATVLLTFSAAADNETDKYCEDAQLLYNIGFMTGDDNGMRLYDELDRAEAAVLLCRAYGAEMEALYYSSECPFEDVPDWAAPYIAYMYDNGFITGKSDKLYDHSAPVTMREFYTILLRMLGYSETDGDFTYENALEIAESICLAEDIELTSDRPFLRIDAAHGVVSALKQCCKGTNTPLVYMSASYIDNSYGMETADIIFGKHEIYEQLEKTRQAMENAGSYTITQYGKYDLNDIDSDYEKEIIIESEVRSNLLDMRAEIGIDVDTMLGGEKIEHMGVNIFCEDGELFYSRMDTGGWLQDNNISAANVERYCRIYSMLFGFESGILDTADMYRDENGIHIKCFSDRFNIIGDITSKQSAGYYFDIDIVIDPETELYKYVDITYNDLWTDAYDRALNADFTVRYDFYEYGSTIVNALNIVKG